MTFDSLLDIVQITMTIYVTWQAMRLGGRLVGEAMDVVVRWADALLKKIEDKRRRGGKTHE